MNEYFITCPRGLEEVTSKDINQYLSTNSYPDKGGVLFNASLKEMYRINLYSRTKTNYFIMYYVIWYLRGCENFSESYTIY